MTTRNYTTFDPAHHSVYLALEQSNTVITTYTSGVTPTARALYAKDAGVWYVEWVPFGEFVAGGGARVGVALDGGSLSQKLGTATDDIGYDTDGGVWKGNTKVATAPAWGVNDVISVVADLNDGVLWLRKNGSVVMDVGLTAGKSYLPASSLWQGTNPASTIQCGLLLSAGQRAFEYLASDTIFRGGFDGGNMPNIGWFDVSAGLGMFRIADRAWMTASTDTPPNIPYDDALGRGGLVLTDALTFWPWGRAASAGRTTVKLHNADADYDSFVSGDPRDADVTLRLGDTGDALEDVTPVARLLVDSARASDDGTLALGLSSRSSRLQTALQRRLILPTADPSAANKPWPWGVGAVRSAEGVQIRAADNLYAASDGTIAGIGAIRDRGAVFDPALDYDLHPQVGTLQLTSEAQGRVTYDYSTLGGELPTGPDDMLNGIGDFDNLNGWTANPNASLYTPGSYSWLRLILGDAYAQQLVSMVKTSTLTLAAGEPYMVELDVYRMRDFYVGMRTHTTDPIYVTAAGDDGSGGIDTTATWGKVVDPDPDVGGPPPMLQQRLIGIARNDGPLHIGVYGGLAGGEFAIDNVRLYHLGVQFDDEALVPSTLAETLDKLLGEKAGLLASDWSKADADAIDTASGYQGVGYFATSDASASIEQALDAILASYSACRYDGDDGRLRIARLIDPTAETATAEIGPADMLSDPTISLDLAPGLTTQAQGRKNWAPLSPSEMVSDDLGLPYGIDGGDI